MRPPRNEYKYLISNKAKDVLISLWNKHLIKDPYTDKDAKTPILSLYYDTPDLLFYNEKLDGIMTRNKIRLRVYDYSFKNDIPCFLEIKQRFGDKVRKVRVYRDKLDQSLLDLDNWSFEKKIENDYFGELCSRYKLRPVAQVFYIRDAYQATVETDVRVTFDSSLMGFRPDEVISRDLIESNTHSLMSDEMCILEIKNNSHHLPRWLLDGIIKLGLVQRSIPKYITAVEKLGINNITLNSGEYI